MRIAHIVSTFPPYKGGMGNACFCQVQELIKLGYTLAVLTPDYKGDKFQVSNFKFQNKHSNFQIIYLKPLLKFGNAAFVPQLIKYLKNFDIIHLHWPFIGGAEIFLLWRLFHRQQKIIVQYQMDLKDSGWRGLFFKLYSLLFLGLLFKSADKIVVSSLDYIQHSRAKKYFKKYPNKFVEIPLGVDIDSFYPSPKNPELIKKYNLKSNDQIILFVGGLDRAHYFKGVDVLLRAVADLRLKIKDFKLLIVGDGDLRPIYEKLAKDLGIEERVIFVGEIASKELPDYYNLADIFVLPSTTMSEAFGLVSLEAMACAKPIIVSDLPGPRTLVQENKNGLLVKPRDVGDLAEKIKFLLENKELAKEWGRVGRKIVEEKYLWPIVVQKLDQIYKII